MISVPPILSGRNTLPEQTERLGALRDFFFAKDAADLCAAARDISRHFRMPLTAGTDWIEAEYDFNRLFVGPATVPAPPYASAYRDEPTLMGAPALQVRELYRNLGLTVPDQGATPDDHLAFELDAVMVLEALLRDLGNEEAPGLVEMRSWLVREHMGEWVPRFIRAALSHEGISEPVSMALHALKQWLDEAGTH